MEGGFGSGVHGELAALNAAAERRDRLRYVRRRSMQTDLANEDSDHDSDEEEFVHAIDDKKLSRYGIGRHSEVASLNATTDRRNMLRGRRRASLQAQLANDDSEHDSDEEDATEEDQKKLSQYGIGKHNELAELNAAAERRNRIQERRRKSVAVELANEDSDHNSDEEELGDGDEQKLSQYGIGKHNEVADIDAAAERRGQIQRLRRKSIQIEREKEDSDYDSDEEVLLRNGETEQPGTTSLSSRYGLTATTPLHSAKR